MKDKKSKIKLIVVIFLVSFSVLVIIGSIIRIGYICNSVYNVFNFKYMHFCGRNSELYPDPHSNILRITKDEYCTDCGDKLTVDNLIGYTDTNYCIKCNKDCDSDYCPHCGTKTDKYICFNEISDIKDLSVLRQYDKDFNCYVNMLLIGLIILVSTIIIFHTKGRE